ncbi:MAG: phosphoserine phosphatase SerB [Sphingomonadales bacterium]
MTHVATVMAPFEALSIGDPEITAFALAVSRLGGKPLDHKWLAKGQVFDLFFEEENPGSDALLEAAGLSGLQIDCIIQKVETRAKKLFVADMDSTIIAEESIDEIALELGLSEKVAPITEAAMLGKLEFSDALRKRVALLKGLSKKRLRRVLDERIHFNPGAKTLIATLKAEAIQTALVSGGFTFFTNPLAKTLGFDFVRANQLEFENGTLNGSVTTPIVDGETKKAFLIETSKINSLQRNQTLALGDGANDIPMFGAAGLSLSYHGKPAAEKAADGNLRHFDLTGVLFALGIPESRFCS